MNLHMSIQHESSYITEDKGVHAFPKDICPKVYVIVLLEYELAK